MKMKMKGSKCPGTRTIQCLLLRRLISCCNRPKEKQKKGGGGEEEYRKERGQINETSVSYEVASGLAVGTGISTDRVSSSLGETLPSDSTLVLKIVVDSGLAGSLVG